MNRILKFEVFIHSDRQLRAAYLILGYTPILSSFQTPKCLIKARDPRLHRINIVVLVFLVTDPIPEGVQQVESSFLHTTEEVATPSQPAIKEEEEIVEVSESKDDFEVFKDLNPPRLPLKILAISLQHE